MKKPTMLLHRALCFMAIAFAAGSAFSQTAKPAAGLGLSKDQPIEISSDTLDVLQNEHKAIFSGNVIAVQGTTNMRAKKMIVYYQDSGAGKDAKTPAPKPTGGAAQQGITKIEAEGNVVFTTPTEVAQGDFGTYDVVAEIIDLTGKSVVLTREQNVLKGTHLVYHYSTGRSILTSSNGAEVGGKPARVHGLFVPKSDEKKPAAGTP